MVQQSYNKQQKTLLNLPLLISVPHGGYTIPFELFGRTNLNSFDIFPDSDPCSQRIYSLQEEVLYYHQSDIARAIVDLNRSPTDLPPGNPDGVIKSHTVMNKKVYKDGQQPGSPLRKQILERYYHPYHAKIQKNSLDPELLCAIDCHTMLEFAPGTPPRPENKRPFICLSNNGGENGEGKKLTCSPDLINILAECLRTEFPEEAESIVLNSPFKGGHICRHHSGELPWIQVELNRKAYLSPEWFDEKTLQVDENRLVFLRNKFLSAFIEFCGEAGNVKFAHELYNLKQAEVESADQSLSL